MTVIDMDRKRGTTRYEVEAPDAERPSQREPCQYTLFPEDLATPPGHRGSPKRTK